MSGVLKRVIVVLACLLVLLGGCSSKKSKSAVATRSPSTTGSPPTTAAAGGTATSGAAGGGSTATTRSSASGGSATTRTTAAGGGTATTAATSGGGSSGVGAKPGTYKYTVSGTDARGPQQQAERFRVNNVQAGFLEATLRQQAGWQVQAPPDWRQRAQQQSGEATTTYDKPSGSDQHFTTTSQAGSSETIYRFGPDAVLLTYLKSTNQAFTLEFRPDPPVTAVPQPPTVGRTWSWHMVSTDQSETFDGSYRIDRTETVTVGNEAVSCYVVVGTLKGTGKVTITTNQTIWASDKYKLRAQEHDVTDGTYQNFPFHADVTEKLESTTPS